MRFWPILLILLLSSIAYNILFLKSQLNDHPKVSCPMTNDHLNNTVIINCTEQAVEFIIGEWLLKMDTRFEEQQSHFNPGDFFPIMEYNNETKKELFNANNFYTRHVSFNYPFVLRGGVNHWKAIKLWKNDSYLIEKIGNLTINVEKKPQGRNDFAYFKKDFKKTKLKYKKFFDLTQNYEKEDFLYYWAEQKLPKTLRKDIKEPKFGLMMNLEEIHIWQVFY